MASSVTLKPNAIDISGSTSGTTTLQASAVAGTTTLTLPAATDTLVGKSTTDTLTNKTLTSPTLTAPVLGTPASGTLTNCTGLPASTGITGTLSVANGGTGLSAFGPSFSARNSSNQSISSSTFTKVTLDTEDFDPNNNFSSSTFTPTVAGYYQINCTIRFNGVAISSAIAAIYKNGSAFTRIVETNSSIGTDFTLSGSAIVYCNGSTDTIEMYGLITGTSPTFNFANSSACCRMSGVYLRG